MEDGVGKVDPIRGACVGTVVNTNHNVQSRSFCAAGGTSGSTESISKGIVVSKALDEGLGNLSDLVIPAGTHGSVILEIERPGLVAGFGAWNLPVVVIRHVLHSHTGLDGRVCFINMDHGPAIGLSGCSRGCLGKVYCVSPTAD